MPSPVLSSASVCSPVRGIYSTRGSPTLLEKTREPATEAPGLLSHPGPAREPGVGCAWGWSAQVLPTAADAALCPYTLVTCVYKGAAAHARTHAHAQVPSRLPG